MHIYMCIYIYIYKTESVLCTPETNTTLQIYCTSIKKKIKATVIEFEGVHARCQKPCRVT